MHSLFFFIIAIAVLVVIHEFGHFWVARRCGVKVLKFSVGFGPVIWRYLAKDGTEYALSAIPLGGYVKMLDEREDDVDPGQLGQAFNRQSLSKRTAIVAAGPLANLLFAVFAYWLVFVIGVTGVKPVIGEVITFSSAEQAGLQQGDQITAINESDTFVWNQVVKQLIIAAESNDPIVFSILRGPVNYSTTIELPHLATEKSSQILSEIGIEPFMPELQPIIGDVLKGGAGERAGLKTGDKLIVANGVQLTTWQQWVKFIQQNPNNDLDVQLLRKGNIHSVSLRPDKNEQGKGAIGVAVNAKATEIPDEYFATIQLDPITAIGKAFRETWQFSTLTVKGIWGMLTGSVSLNNIGGPITIAQIAGASAENGVVAFLQMLAIISISLGILNLLPIPVLDGGHLVFYVIEAAKGSQLSIESQVYAQKIGMFFLLSLMMLAFFNDFTRLFG